MKNKFPGVKLRTADDWFEAQYFVDGHEAWKVETLWEAAEDLPAYDVPLVGMNIDISPWDDVTNNFLDYLSHVKLIMNADLDYPIILTPLGSIADGRHRIGKAIIEGQTTIKVKRLPFMPEPDMLFDDEGNTTFDIDGEED